MWRPVRSQETSDNNTVEGEGGWGGRSQVGNDREVKNDTMEVWTLKVAPANLAHQACHQTKGKSQKKKKKKTTNDKSSPGSPEAAQTCAQLEGRTVWLRTHSHLHSATSAALFKACRLKLCACVRAHIPQPLVSWLTARSRDAPAWRNLEELGGTWWNLVELVRLNV